jgi:hypothetical protein
VPDNDIDRGPWWGRVIEMMVKYVSAQTFNNALLLTIIFGGAYVCIKLVPIHLTQIQQGYEREGAANRELIERLDEYHREERMQTFEYLREMWGSKKVASH